MVETIYGPCGSKIYLLFLRVQLKVDSLLFFVFNQWFLYYIPVYLYNIVNMSTLSELICYVFYLVYRALQKLLYYLDWLLLQISNGVVQLEALFEPLLDLCSFENVSWWAIFFQDCVHQKEPLRIFFFREQSSGFIWDWEI